MIHFLLFNPWTSNFTERVSNCIRNGRQLHNNGTYTQCVLMGIFIVFLIDFLHEVHNRSIILLERYHNCDPLIKTRYITLYVDCLVLSADVAVGNRLHPIRHLRYDRKGVHHVCVSDNISVIKSSKYIQIQIQKLAGVVRKYEAHCQFPPVLQYRFGVFFADLRPQMLGSLLTPVLCPLRALWHSVSSSVPSRYPNINRSAAKGMLGSYSAHNNVIPCNSRFACP